MTEVVEVRTACPNCDKINVIMVDPEKLARWFKGEHIQDVWPEWTSQQRETLMTGICSDECWRKMVRGTVFGY